MGRPWLRGPDLLTGNGKFHGHMGRLHGQPPPSIERLKSERSDPDVRGRAEEALSDMTALLDETTAF